MGLEILDQVPDVEAVVIPIGGGGLIAGCAIAIKTLKPDVMVIGVEPERCQSFTNAIKHGTPIHTLTRPSLADGLTVPTVGCNALATGAPLIDKVVAVSEAWIAVAILRLVELEKAVVEGAGATGLAALLAGLLPELKGKKVVLPLCGGNIDTTLLGRCLERGLAADGRLLSLTVTVSDRPGGVADLTRCLSNVGASIKDIVHERAWVKQDTFSVGVKVVLETRNRMHSREVLKILREQYDDVHVLGFYESVTDYVSGTLNSEQFETVEDETPFDGGMNVQYHQDHDAHNIETEEDSSSDSGLSNGNGETNQKETNQKIPEKVIEKTPRIKLTLN
jgi:threonine dehydratase